MYDFWYKWQIQLLLSKKPEYWYQVFCSTSEANGKLSNCINNKQYEFKELVWVWVSKGGPTTLKLRRAKKKKWAVLPHSLPLSLCYLVHEIRELDWNKYIYNVIINEWMNEWVWEWVWVWVSKGGPPSLKLRRAKVALSGIEPESRAPETLVLSIEL